jgi:hypothetical protein
MDYLVQIELAISMAERFGKHQQRCEQIDRADIGNIPERIEFICDSGKTATTEQTAAAMECCCPLCMEGIEKKTAPQAVCFVCQRRCCQFCSHVRDGNVVCISKTCGILLGAGDLSSQEMFSTCVSTCKHLLCQWLVLQEKNEKCLGPLRALVLMDALRSAKKAIELQEFAKQLAVRQSAAE